MGLRGRAEDAQLCPGEPAGASPASCPAHRGPRHRHFALRRAEEGSWHDSPPSKSLSEALSRAPSCRERLALSRDKPVLPLGDPQPGGCGIAWHCPVARGSSNAHLEHLGIGKRSPCTHLPTLCRPHGDARRVPVPAPAGQGASRVGCQRRAARPGSRPVWRVASTGDDGTIGTECRRIPRAPMGTVAPGVPSPAPGLHPQFPRVAPRTGRCPGSPCVCPMCDSPTATGEAVGGGGWAEGARLPVSSWQRLGAD